MERQNFNANYGGIIKNVSLPVTGKIYQPWELPYNTSTPLISILKDNLQISLLKPEETKVFSATGHLLDIHFWSWGYGYLYTENKIPKKDGKVIDEVTSRTGFRKTEFSNGMIKLNDRVINIKG